VGPGPGQGEGIVQTTNPPSRYALWRGGESRSWYENPLGVTPWGFESPRPHQIVGWVERSETHHRWPDIGSRSIRNLFDQWRRASASVPGARPSPLSLHRNAQLTERFGPVNLLYMPTASATLARLKPTSRQLVMDLVRDAGLDVSDWQNFRGGKERAASNPKYCYEWAFVQPGASVVLNLWYENMRVGTSRIFQRLNLRRRASALAKSPSATVWKARASKVDQAIQIAYRQRSPIRVIVCDGKMRPSDDPSAKASQVQRRLLDPLSWAVTAYEWSSGECTLERGASPSVPANLPIDDELAGFEGESRKRFVLHRKREAKMRGLKIADSLRRNNGRLVCEVPHCGFNFMARYGELGQGYAQVHHKLPLSAAPKEGRKLRLQDLAVVCANCHAMIHRHGECRPIQSLIPRPR
jgi:5-methylcytosine-specific restriction protein A